jgi:hypothetical protein
MGAVAKFPRTKNFYSTKLNLFVTLCKTSIRGLTDIPNSVVSSPHSKIRVILRQSSGDLVQNKDLNKI